MAGSVSIRSLYILQHSEVTPLWRIFPPSIPMQGKPANRGRNNAGGRIFHCNYSNFLLLKNPIRPGQFLRKAKMRFWLQFSQGTNLPLSKVGACRDNSVIKIEGVSHPKGAKSGNDFRHGFFGQPAGNQSDFYMMRL